MLVGFLIAVSVLGVSSAEEAKQENGVYAIVAEKETVENAPWKDVVKALQKKHSAKVFYWNYEDASELRENLAKLQPRYVCFVARPDELARAGKIKAKIMADGNTQELLLCGAYYHKVGMLMRSLDDDPYDDAQWAILTGATPEDALRVVSAKPLLVCRGLSHVGTGWLKWLPSGVSFSECKKGQKWIKEPDKPPEEVKGPDDTTEQFVAELNSGNADMVSGSGHATEHDWQLGYSYRSGQIITAKSGTNYKVGQLLGMDTSKKVYEILADNPKVYYAPGNCRIARVDGENCMVLGWIHHGAMQFFGHVGLQSRSCYAWGVAEYFLALQGRFSFAESVWLNRQALRWQVSQMNEEDKKTKYMCCRNEMLFPLGWKLFCQTTTFYGDPAWQAHVKPTTEPLYDQQLYARELEDDAVELTFTATMRRASLPSRPAAFFVETSAGSQIEVKEGPENLLIADNFALIPFWPAGDPVPEPGKKYKAVVVVNSCENE